MRTLLQFTAVSAVLSTTLFATNGDELISLGAKSRGMGGVSIGISHGAESALSNPAQITSIKSKEVSFGGTLLLPNVETNGRQSDADISIAPAIAIAGKMNENFYIGIGMWGTAGMGVDYRGTNVNDNMTTNLQLMQFGIPLSYKIGNLSLGVAPILQYGALDIDYDGSSTRGAAQDLAFGYNAGVAYSIDSVSLGAVYKSSIAMSYKGQISALMNDYIGGSYSDKLEQPEEYGFGIGYQIGKSTIGIDYKRINWSKADGYKIFGWNDQDVYAVGYEHDAGKWAFRAGYNYAKSPIENVNSQTIDVLNLLAFPAIVESHYTVGGTVRFNNQTSVDMAYVYVPEKSEKVSTTSTNHSQNSISAQLTYDF